MVELSKKYCIICGKEITSIRRLKEGKDTCSKSCANRKRYLDPNERLKQSIANKKAMTDEVRQKISSSMKTEELVKLHKEKAKLLSSNKEIVEKRSNSIRRHWDNSTKEQRKTHSDLIKEGQKNCNAIDKISKASKEHWQDDKYRDKMISSLKEYWSNEEHSKIQSDKLKKAYENPKLRQKISQLVKDSMTDEVKQKISNSVKLAYENPELRQKISKLIKQAYIEHHDEIMQKTYNTRKKNNSFNTSQPEQYIKQLLEQKFNNVHYQYRSELYPFNCDFYIEDLNLYVECNFSWTHGSKPYDENDSSCKEQLRQWQEKAKTSDYYKNAIYTWTDLDVRKLETFKKNSLNYKIFYNLDEFNEWAKIQNDF